MEEEEDDDDKDDEVDEDEDDEVEELDPVDDDDDVNDDEETVDERNGEYADLTRKISLVRKVPEYIRAKTIRPSPPPPFPPDTCNTLKAIANALGWSEWPKDKDWGGCIDDDDDDVDVDGDDEGEEELILEAAR